MNPNDLGISFDWDCWETYVSFVEKLVEDQWAVLLDDGRMCMLESWARRRLGPDNHLQTINVQMWDEAKHDYCVPEEITLIASDGQIVIHSFHIV